MILSESSHLSSLSFLTDRGVCLVSACRTGDELITFSFFPVSEISFFFLLLLMTVYQDPEVRERIPDGSFPPRRVYLALV